MRFAPKRILAISAVQLVYTVAVLYVARAMPFFAYALPFSDLLLLDVILGNPPINRKWPLMLLGGADLIVTFFTFGTPGAIIIANGVFEIGWFLASFAGPLIGLILLASPCPKALNKRTRRKSRERQVGSLFTGMLRFILSLLQL